MQQQFSLTVSNHWVNLCTELSLPLSLASSWWNIIRTNYSHPTRFYHTLQHLDEFLRHYRENSHLLQPLPLSNSNSLAHRHSFLLAIYFHDLVYVPKSPPFQNEDKSIELFQLFLKECGDLPNHEELNQLGPYVIELIELTKKHQFSDEIQLLNPRINAKLFCDMDMAILGSTRERYTEYSQQVRFEFQHVPLPIYVQKRTEFLLTCLPSSSSPSSPSEGTGAGAEAVTKSSSKQIFHTELFFSKYEHLAYENIRWEINSLSTMLRTSAPMEVTKSKPSSAFSWTLCYPFIVPIICLLLMKKI